MAPHSVNGTYSDGSSQVLWEDGERVFRRGWRLDDNGKRAVLLAMPAADQPSRSSLDRLTHEYELRDDGAWAARPLRRACRRSSREGDATDVRAPSARRCRNRSGARRRSHR